MRGNGIPGAPMVVLPKTELTEYVDPQAVRVVALDAIESMISQLGTAYSNQTKSV